MKYETHPYVYRMYAGDDLIYIGSTRRLWRRLAEHRIQSWWSPTVTRVQAKLQPTIHAARREEKRAVADEMPRWNVYDQRIFIPTWNDDQFGEYLERWLIHNIEAEKWHWQMFGASRIDVRLQFEKVLRRYKLHHGRDFDISTLQTQVPA
jgi:predicted GIY-YIG superfamily endonuclease